MVGTVAWCRLHICNLSPDLPFGSGKKIIAFHLLKEFCLIFIVDISGSLKHMAGCQLWYRNILAEIPGHWLTSNN
jgi:hypothetical protein